MPVTVWLPPERTRNAATATSATAPTATATSGVRRTRIEAAPDDALNDAAITGAFGSVACAAGGETLIEASRTPYARSAASAGGATRITAPQGNEPTVVT